MQGCLQLLADETGSVAVETALTLVLVVVASYLSFQSFGHIVRDQIAAVREPLVPGS